MTTFYKFTRADRAATHAGDWRWDRLKKWQPAQTPVMCESGYHLTTSAHLIDWLDTELWVAEGRGLSVVGDTKVVFAQARLVERVTAWDERLARHFAADCAERVLPIFEKHHPGDDRPRKAVEAARAFADGLITEKELAAARAATWAAWAAPGDAAGDAARDAARAAGDAARAAAWAAAGAAARATWAAGNAAWAAAGAAERDWQAKHLCDLLNIDYEPIPSIEGVAS